MEGARSSWVWVTVTLVLATTLLPVRGEPSDSAAKGFLQRYSWNSNSNTSQEQRGNTDVMPQAVPQNERNFKDGSPSEPGKRKNFESTADLVAGDLKSQDAQQALKNAHRQWEKQFNVRIKRQIRTSVHSTPFSQPTTDSSVSGQDTSHDNSVTPNITLVFESDQNDSYSDYNDYDDYYDNDYYHDDVYNYPLRLIGFTRRLFLCEYIFSALYMEYTNFTEVKVSYGNTSLSLVTNATFLNICLPLFLGLSASCHRKGLITICDSEDIAFLHTEDCQEPSSDDLYFQQLLFATLVEEDYVCFQAVCEGSLRVVEREVEGVLVRLISPNTTTCHRYLQEYYQEEQLNETMGLHRTRNRYWPCCFPGYDVLWMGETEALSAVAKDWSYLPSHCRFGEGFLVLMVLCLVMGGVLGNILVVAVLMRRYHHGMPTTILYISFALASLLLSCIVMAPSLYKHLYLISSDYSLQAPSTDVDEVEGGFQLFSAAMMTLCSILTQVNMFALSLERLLSATEFVLWKNVITRPRVKGFVIVTWTSSLFVSLVLASNRDGMFLVLWYSFDKLPFGVSPRGMKILPAVISSMVIVALLTGVLLVLYVRNYRKKRELENLSELNSDGTGYQSPHRVTVFMVFMGISSICSTLMGGLACLLHLSAARFAHVELLRYLCWWVFLGASSWNSWLYVLQIEEFRSDAAALLKRLVPRKVFGKDVPQHPSNPKGWRRKKVRRNRHLPGILYSAC